MSAARAEREPSRAELNRSRCKKWSDERTMTTMTGRRRRRRQRRWEAELAIQPRERNGFLRSTFFPRFPVDSNRSPKGSLLFCFPFSNSRVSFSLSRVAFVCSVVARCWQTGKLSRSPRWCTKKTRAEEDDDDVDDDDDDDDDDLARSEGRSDTSKTETNVEETPASKPAS